MKKSGILLVVTLLMAGACASVNTSKSADSETYKEDLSVHRSLVVSIIDTTRTDAAIAREDFSEVVPANDVTQQLNEVLEGSDQLRKGVNVVDGYTIQIYVGKDTDEARKVRGQALAMVPDEYVELFYDEPNFKVKVGQFYNRTEARSTYATLGQKFPNALVIPDKIPIPEP